MNIPADLMYTKDHEWIRVEGKIGIIGITDYAQHQLGDIVFVELPPVGKKAAKGDVLATVESVKAVSEIYAPVSGTVIQVNSTLTDSPEKLNQDPFGEGWVAKMEITSSDELNTLFDAAAYEKYLGEAKK